MQSEKMSRGAAAVAVVALALLAAGLAPAHSQPLAKPPNATVVSEQQQRTEQVPRIQAEPSKDGSAPNQIRRAPSHPEYLLEMLDFGVISFVIALAAHADPTYGFSPVPWACFFTFLWPLSHALAPPYGVGICLGVPCLWRWVRRRQRASPQACAAAAAQAVRLWDISKPTDVARLRTFLHTCGVDTAGCTSDQAVTDLFHGEVEKDLVNCVSWFVTADAVHPEVWADILSAIGTAQEEARKTGATSMVVRLLRGEAWGDEVGEPAPRVAGGATVQQPAGSGSSQGGQGRSTTVDAQTQTPSGALSMAGAHAADGVTSDSSQASNATPAAQPQTDHSVVTSGETGISGGAGSGAGTTVSSHQCAQCGVQPAAGSKLKKCALCRQARYCSADCQRTHWRAGHKANCPGVKDTGGSG